MYTSLAKSQLGSTAGGGGSGVVLASARLKDGVKPGLALNIKFSVEVLSLLGITTAALVGSPLVDATKKSKTPAPATRSRTVR